MKSLENAYLKKLSIPNRLFSVVRQIGEYKGRQDLYRQQAPQMLENLRRVAVIQSTESSNRLEGIVANPNRLRALLEEKTTPANRSEAEIAGYRDVLNTIHQNYPRIHLNENVILQLHRDLMQYSPTKGGEWKTLPNEVIAHYPDGTVHIRFQPVEPLQTPEYMKSLNREYQRLTTKLTWEPSLLIPFYILDFLCIHPFADGNGRMARLLTVLMLYHQGYEVGRYISLERIVEETKDSYYDTLYHSSQGWHKGEHDPWPWTEYFLGILLAAYREFESRVDTVSSGRGNKTEMVKIAIDSFLSEFSISELEKACPTVSRDMIRHVLFQLRNQGKIKVVGKGRGAKWQKIV